MNKFWGLVGFVKQVETSPDVWTEQVTERHYSCEKVRNGSRWQTSNYTTTNDDLVLDNRVSILADPYAWNEISSIRYLVRRGSKWNVTSIEENYPRLILTLGGIYHGNSDASRVPGQASKS
jgi:hypothetical protein